MSKGNKRLMKMGGWIDYKKHPRGPNGRGLCRLCNTEVPKGRRTFCGQSCVHEYRLRNDSGYQSKTLRKLDASVCSICNTNTDIIKAQYHESRVKINKNLDDLYWGTEDHKLIHEIRHKLLKELEQKYKEQGWDIHRINWFDVDHIVPVCEGGGPDDWPSDKAFVENLRTLCVPCHKIVTAKLRKRLKRRREG